LEHDALWQDWPGFAKQQAGAVEAAEAELELEVELVLALVHGPELTGLELVADLIGALGDGHLS